MAGVTTGVIGSSLSLNFGCRSFSGGLGGRGSITTEKFAQELRRTLPVEDSYAQHQRLSEGSMHVCGRRDVQLLPEAGEVAVDGKGWTLIWQANSSEVIQTAAADFQDYMKRSMGVDVALEPRPSIAGLVAGNRQIVVGTGEQLPSFARELKNSKDYGLYTTPQSVTVCGYDDKGAMHGLYNLEARMNLREAPYLPGNLSLVRHSLYEVRMVHSWMGWMEWPDKLLAHMAHDGIDGIFCSVYANPNGDRTTADNSTDWYARLMYQIRKQDPAKIKDLVKRAARYGIKVYTPIIHLYTGTPENEAELRKLVRDIVTELPGIKGYVLLTEGFWYDSWGGWRKGDKEQQKEWARNWCKGVEIVAEECHRINPEIEILPWEYNVGFSPENVEIKAYYGELFPKKSTPLMTWENGCSFALDNMRGSLRDYSLCQIGPAEVTTAQMANIRKRGMKFYTKVDTFASWQYGTSPYLPFPYQWHARYKALAQHGVHGTLESWSSGYSPSFITELRAWSCWSNDPELDDILRGLARRIFGEAGIEGALHAWKLFSEAIKLVPDTGPNMGTNSAVANPLFFQEQPPRTPTYNYSWTDFDKWKGYHGAYLNPCWPYTVTRMVFYPDFSNRINKAEAYARSATGIYPKDKGARVLPAFLKYLHKAADLMEEGLLFYRAAALKAPAHKREQAMREVVVAEQLQRMMLSDCTILEFEELRFNQAKEKNKKRALLMLDEMEQLFREEIQRTELSLLAASRDSRLGFQYEQDYVYTPFSLREKLRVMQETLKNEFPVARRSLKAQI